MEIILHRIKLATWRSKASIPQILKYLAGCKYFTPKGRWVLASEILLGNILCKLPKKVVIGNCFFVAS